MKQEQPNTQTEWIAIGEAAKQLGISTKRLRNWDAIGKLKPLKVNESGHRFYAPWQIQTFIYSEHEAKIRKKREAKDRAKQAREKETKKQQPQDLSISEAAAYLQINTHTLRVWERTGKFVATYRSEGGHRYYSEADLKRIKLRLEAEGALKVPKVRTDLTMAEAVEAFGVKASTLRRWDKENILKPARIGNGGHRYYTRDQVQAYHEAQQAKKVDGAQMAEPKHNAKPNARRMDTYFEVMEARDIQPRKKSNRCHRFWIEELTPMAYEGTTIPLDIDCCVSTGKTRLALSVTHKTLRNWEEAGILVPYYRSKEGKRFYHQTQIDEVKANRLYNDDEAKTAFNLTTKVFVDAIQSGALTPYCQDSKGQWFFRQLELDAFMEHYTSALMEAEQATAEENNGSLDIATPEFTLEKTQHFNTKDPNVEESTDTDIVDVIQEKEKDELNMPLRTKPTTALIGYCCGYTTDQPEVLARQLAALNADLMGRGRPFRVMVDVIATESDARPELKALQHLIYNTKSVDEVVFVETKQTPSSDLSRILTESFRYFKCQVSWIECHE